MDEEADVHVINPMNLTLDELISLNSLKNQNTEGLEANDVEPINGFEKPTNGFRRPKNAYKKPVDGREQNYGNKDYKQRVQDRLRKMPQFGTKKIHQRLGFFNPDSRMQMKSKDMTSYRMAIRAKKALKIAHDTHWRSQQKAPSLYNPSRTVHNDLMLLPGVSPLTRHSVSVFDRLNRSGPYSRSSAPSISSAMSQQPKRHCIKNLLKEEYQQQIRQLAEACPDYKRTCPEDIQEFHPTPAATRTPLGVRFFSYQ